MRILTAKAKSAVQHVIENHIEELSALPNFISAEPGFPLVDGEFLTEPAVIVYVSQKLPRTHLPPADRAPRQLGRYRVSVMQADPVRQLMALRTAGDLPGIPGLAPMAVGALTYQPIEGNPIDTVFTVKTPLLCHVGPDAGWPVLKPFLEATEHSLSVAMYDFSSKYIATALINHVEDTDAKVVMNWDDAVATNELFDTLSAQLEQLFDGGVVECGAGHRFDSAYHEKVAVRDSRAFWLSSGNWTPRSQPEIDPIGNPETAKGMYSKYNREWHVVVEDEALAQVFERYITYDRDGSKAEAAERDITAVPALGATLGAPDVFVPIDTLAAAAEEVSHPVAPRGIPVPGRGIEVQPVLTPDNYLDRVTALLAGAKKSIYLQFAYINYNDDPGNEGFTAMLDTLARLSRRSDIDMKIIVGADSAAAKTQKLVQAAGFRSTVFRRQGNIHNKGIVVDGKTVLVSSANWSADGVLRNRDAGVIIHDPDIAGYYQDVFLDDWQHRASKIGDDPTVMIAAEGVPTPAGMVRMSWHDYLEN